MNRQVMALALLLLIPAAAFSQDDIYFVPSEEHHPAAYAETVAPAPVNAETYYSGSTRDVDEYNRRGTYVQQIDSAGNDIIDFDGSMGVYPDSACDYECTRQMSRFDDYDWAGSYWAGYADGRWDSWWWNDPWYYGSWYYGSWYYPWGYAGWYYRPWGYYSWYPHHYYWHVGSYYRPYHGITGTSNHGFVSRGQRTTVNNGFRGYRGNRNTVTNSGNRTPIRNFSGNRGNNTNTTVTRQPSFSGSNSFGSVRSGGGFSGSRGGGFSGSRGGSGGFGGRR